MNERERSAPGDENVQRRPRAIGERLTGRRALQWTAGALLVAVFVGVFSVYSYNQGLRQGPQSAQNIVSDIPLDAPKDYQYILRAQDGRLAVFLRGQEEAQMVFDVAVRVLPEYDQRQLEGGIYVKDYQTLVGLIEDYVS